MLREGSGEDGRGCSGRSGVLVGGVGEAECGEECWDWRVW